MVRTKRAAKAFRFGARGGRRTGWTPTVARVSRNRCPVDDTLCEPMKEGDGRGSSLAPAALRGALGSLCVLEVGA